MILLKYLKREKKLDTDLKIILLNHQNNCVECLNVDDNKFYTAKNFNRYSSNQLIKRSTYNYFDDPNKIIFRSIFSEIFRYFKSFFPQNYHYHGNNN